MSATGPNVPARTRRQQRRDELINTSIRASFRPSTPSGAAVWTVVALVVLWVFLLVNLVADHSLTRHLSIRPRQARGIIGILTSPLVHADAAHLAANTLPFAALCWIMLWSGLRAFALVTPAVWVGAGAADWLAGPSHAHLVGVSGVVFGWMGYVIARAFYGRSVRAIAVAVVVALVFSSTFTGLLPNLQSNVYWLGHVVGFAVGVGLAAALHRRRPDSAAPAQDRRRGQGPAS